MKLQQTKKGGRAHSKTFSNCDVSSSSEEDEIDRFFNTRLLLYLQKEKCMKPDKKDTEQLVLYIQYVHSQIQKYLCKLTEANP